MSAFELEKELDHIFETYSNLEIKLLQCQSNLEVGRTVWFFSAYEHTSNSGIDLDDIAIMRGTITEKTFKGNYVGYKINAKCWEGDSEELVRCDHVYLSKELAYKAWLNKILEFERLSPDE